MHRAGEEMRLSTWGNPQRGRGGILLGLLIALGIAALPGPTSAGPAPMPDLRPLRPDFVSVGQSNSVPPVRELGFRTLIANHGAVPLEVIVSGPADGSEPTQRLAAAECGEWAVRLCLRHDPIGDLVFSEEHGTWLLERFALYELRFLVGGQPDYDRPALATVEKATACLRDLLYDEGNPADDGVARALRLYPPFCVPLRQGISPGWVHFEDPEDAGQVIPLGSIADGEYALIIRIDPDNRLTESNEENNTVILPLRIAGNSVTEI